MLFKLPSIILFLTAAISVAANHHHTNLARDVISPKGIIERRSSACGAARREKRMHKQNKKRLGRRGQPNRMNFKEGGNKGGDRPSGSPPSGNNFSGQSSSSSSAQQGSYTSRDGSTSSSHSTSATNTQQGSQTQGTASSSVAASSSTATSSSSSSHTGEATFFYQGGVAGACGTVHSDSDKVVAIMSTLYGDTGSASQYCGKTVVITNTANSKTVTATVADACPSCTSEYSLDLSTGAFDLIGDEDTGVLDISWYFSD